MISSYKQATEDALDKAIIIEKEVTERVQVNYDYAATPSIMRLVKEFELVMVDQAFEVSCKLILEVKVRDKERFIEKLVLFQATGIDLKFLVLT